MPLTISARPNPDVPPDSIAVGVGGGGDDPDTDRPAPQLEDGEVSPETETEASSTGGTPKRLADVTHLDLGHLGQIAAGRELAELVIDERTAAASWFASKRDRWVVKEMAKVRSATIAFAVGMWEEVEGKENTSTLHRLTGFVGASLYCVSFCGGDRTLNAEHRAGRRARALLGPGQGVPCREFRADGERRAGYDDDLPDRDARFEAAVRHHGHDERVL